MRLVFSLFPVSSLDQVMPMANLSLELVSTFDEKEVPCLCQRELATTCLALEVANENKREIK